MLSIYDYALTKSLFGEIIVPKSVYDEIAIKGAGKHGDGILGTAEYIRIENVQNRLAVDMLIRNLITVKRKLLY